MQFQPLRQRQQLALLLAALMLLANVVVTAHTFGEATHAVAENCQLLHQFERQHDAPVDLATPHIEQQPPLLPASLETEHSSSAPLSCYRSRAPPRSA